jgi:hypothetical protein
MKPEHGVRARDQLGLECRKCGNSLIHVQARPRRRLRGKI